jgi:hypothetical protein
MMHSIEQHSINQQMVHNLINSKILWIFIKIYHNLKNIHFGTEYFQNRDSSQGKIFTH